MLLKPLIDAMEQILPYWEFFWFPLSSWFILFSLRGFPFALPCKRPSLLLFLAGCGCGVLLYLGDLSLKNLLPTGFSHMYLYISLLSLCIIIPVCLLLYRGGWVQIAVTAMLLYNIFSNLRFILIGLLHACLPGTDFLLLLDFSELPTGLLCALLSVLIPRWQKNTLSGFSRGESVLWFSLSLADTVLLCILASFSGTWQNQVLLSGVLLLNTALIYVLISMYSFQKRLATEQRKMLRNTDRAQAYLEQMKEVSSQLRAVKHELKNHVFYLDELASRQDYEALRSYLATLKTLEVNPEILSSSGHSIIDTVINQKGTYARSLGIRTEAHVQLPEDLHIDDLTLCTVLGNLLDNATEGSAGADDPFITVDIAPYKEYLLIRTRNRVSRNVIKENPHLLTTKEDADNHGIGLKVVENAVKAYGGSLRLSMEDKHTFSASVLMKFHEIS